MAGSTIQFDLKSTGFKEFDKRIKRLALANSNYKKPLKLCQLRMQKSVDENFKSQGVPSLGIYWKKLAKWTLAGRHKRKGRRRGKGGDRILLDTGRLRGSLVGSRGRDAIRRITPTALFFGTNVQYASKQQFGGMNKAWSGKVLVGSFKRRAPGKKRKTINVNPFNRRGHIPATRTAARPFLVVKPRDVLIFNQIFMAYEAGAFGASRPA